MVGQLSIFDFMTAPAAVRPRIIEDLSKDVAAMFAGYDKCRESYTTWAHVPQYGKRYEVWYRNVVTVDLDTMQRIKDKYKAQGLEVSVSVIPSVAAAGAYNYMVSTMWLTKGHIEMI